MGSKVDDKEFGGVFELTSTFPKICSLKFYLTDYKNEAWDGDDTCDSKDDEDGDGNRKEYVVEEKEGEGKSIQVEMEMMVMLKMQK